MRETLYQLDEQLNPEHTGLLIVDTQNDFLHVDGGMSVKRGIDASHCREAVPHINDLIGVARSTGVQVMYVGVVLRPETAMPTKVAIRGGLENLWPVPGSWGADWFEELEPPQEGDLVFEKHTYDAFWGTPLRLYLKALGLKTLVLAGFGTEVCVETTARSAYTEGYYVVIPRDSTAAFDPRSYEPSLSVLGRYFGKVVTVEEIAKIWAQR